MISTLCHIGCFHRDFLIHNYITCVSELKKTFFVEKAVSIFTSKVVAHGTLNVYIVLIIVSRFKS